MHRTPPENKTAVGFHSLKKGERVHAVRESGSARHDEHRLGMMIRYGCSDGRTPLLLFCTTEEAPTSNMLVGASGSCLTDT